MHGDRGEEGDLSTEPGRGARGLGVGSPGLRRRGEVGAGRPRAPCARAAAGTYLRPRPHVPGRPARPSARGSGVHAT